MHRAERVFRRLGKVPAPLSIKFDENAFLIVHHYVVVVECDDIDDLTLPYFRDWLWFHCRLELAIYEVRQEPA
jgi:hypothetical protein